MRPALVSSTGQLGRDLTARDDRDLVRVKACQVGLDLLALGRLAQLPVSVLGDLWSLLSLLPGQLPGGACWPVQARDCGVADQLAMEHICDADDAVGL